MKRNAIKRRPKTNPSALGWVGIGVGAAAGAAALAGLVVAGVVFYRMTKL